eukprot:scaffold7788_cov239-Pinguiococcus_pyrenoidosus.AAC.2
MAASRLLRVDICATDLSAPPWRRRPELLLRSDVPEKAKGRFGPFLLDETRARAARPPLLYQGLLECSRRLRMTSGRGFRSETLDVGSGLQNRRGVKGANFGIRTVGVDYRQKRWRSDQMEDELSADRRWRDEITSAVLQVR